MLLPFLMVKTPGGVHHRIRDDSQAAVILPNIPTVCVTDEKQNVTGCVAVGTKEPLPILVGFINSDDKVQYVKSKDSGLPIHNADKEEIDEEDQYTTFPNNTHEQHIQQHDDVTHIHTHDDN